MSPSPAEPDSASRNKIKKTMCGKSTKCLTMTYKQEMKEALKAIKGYEREKRAGKLKVAKKASDFFEEGKN